MCTVEGKVEQPENVLAKNGITVNLVEYNKLQSFYVEFAYWICVGPLS